MTMYTKETVMTASLGAAFVDGIRASVSIPELSGFDSDHSCDISWFF